MHVLIETDRLVIRPLALSDDEGMFAMDSDPEVHKYVGGDPVKTIERTREVIGTIRQQYVEFGIGRWAVVEKETTYFAGWLGFRFTKGPVNGHSNYYDFGYRLAKRFWGKGYATEAGKGALAYGIGTLHLKDIYATTDIDNAASRRVLEKLGFKYIETFNYDAELTWRKEGEPTTWYRLV